ncbi:MAG: hypothetical protein HGB17_11370 [Syntrophobacteraceae bacterium]|nr:hypothetical protein [Syntrophobacteraceae bacterium]
MSKATRYQVTPVSAGGLVWVVMGVGWAVWIVVAGDVGGIVGAGAVHPLKQSITMRAVAMSPYMSGFIVCDLKFRYIILLMKECPVYWLP